MISTEEREKWLKTLGDYNTVALLRRKFPNPAVWLDNLAATAAWASALLDRVSDFFPQFTPHSFTNHVANLLAILDWLLSDSLKHQMTGQELFVLLAGCITHDVGMAVSRREIDDLSTNPRYIELRHELRDQYGHDIDEENIKRQWIRLHHHLRSADSVTGFFESIGDPALGLAVAATVRGHGVPIEEVLSNPSTYLSEYPLAPSALINIPAIVSYLRLADILDCTRTRTPATLFNFIDPADPVSRGEWSRHLSTLSISSDAGRANIIGLARTADFQIFLTLRGYERVVNNEMAVCRRLLSFQPERYRLDLRSFQLTIVTDGFEPVEWQFAINREAVLGLLLGHNLYSNPATCVRELLQNAVDACRQQAKLVSSYTPAVKLSMAIDDDSLYLECLDNGTGMTVEVFERFLLQIGRRYYDSEYYKRIYASPEARIEAVARYGIGFLSCFMIADEVTVTTKADSEKGFQAEFHGSIDYIVRRPAPSLTRRGTRVRLKVNRLLRQDFDLVECVRGFVGLLEIPVIVSDLRHNKEVRLKRSTIPPRSRRPAMVFKRSSDAGIEGYVAPTNADDLRSSISQLGFRIPVESLLPRWAFSFDEVLDLSGQGKVELTTSREKIADESQVSKIRGQTGAKFLEYLKEQFSLVRNVPAERRAWEFVQQHVNLAHFTSDEGPRAVQVLREILPLVHHQDTITNVITIAEVISRGSRLFVTPPWSSNAEPPAQIGTTQEFMCHGAEIGYGRWVHDALQLLLGTTGEPTWIDWLKTHAWEYRPGQRGHGWLSGKRFTSLDFTWGEWQIDVDCDVEIKAAHCDSPYLVLGTPYSYGGFILNSTRLRAMRGGRLDQQKADELTAQIVENVILQIKEEIADDVTEEVRLPRHYGGGKFSFGSYDIETERVVKYCSRAFEKEGIPFTEQLVSPELS